MARRPAEIAALGSLATTILDARLARLRHAVDARDASLSRLEGLEQPFPAVEVNEVAAALARLRYEHWADQRRVELRAMIAAQNAEIDRARGEAETAFGRADVLRRLKNARPKV